MSLKVRRPRMLKVLCECTNPEDRMASYSDACAALGMRATAANIGSLEDMLLDEYKKEGYVTANRNDGCVYVTQKTFSENARNENKWHRLRWYSWIILFAAILAIARFFWDMSK